MTDGIDRRQVLKRWLGAGSAAAAAGVAGIGGAAHAEPGGAGSPADLGEGYGPVVNVRSFGARGDGVADDTKALQAAIDHALVSRIAAVHIPAGIYRTTDTIHVGGRDFSTLSLIGEPTFAYGKSAGTLIVPDAIDRPALNIQGARGNVVRGISIHGRNMAHMMAKHETLAGAADPDPAGWLDRAIPAGLDRHAPYAAITIDGLAGQPKSGGYPPPAAFIMGGQTFPRSRAYSSDILIDRCRLVGFAVGIAVQPGNADGNGDFLKVIASQIEMCVYGIAVGNSQSRNVAIRDCTYARVHTFITNTRFGRGTGTLGGPIDNLSGGAAYQLLDVTGAYTHPLTISHLYFEAQQRIGVIGVSTSFNSPIIFQSCTFSFGETIMGASPAAMLECGTHTSVKFAGCAFVSARRAINLVSGADFAGLDSCMAGIVEDWRGDDFYRGIPTHAARSLDYLCGGIFIEGDSLAGQISLDGATNGLTFPTPGNVAGTLSRGRVVKAAAGHRAVVHHYARDIADRSGRVWPIKARPPAHPIRKLKSGGGTLFSLSYVAPDEIEFTAPKSLMTTMAARPVPGDVLHDSGSGTLFSISAVAVEGDAVRVRALQLNNLRSAPGGPPRSASNVTTVDGYLWLYHANIMAGDAVYFGDYTAGSRTVTNVHTGNGQAAGLATALVPGDRLHDLASGLPLAGSDRVLPYDPMTGVAAVDEAAKTVTLDKPATVTARYLVSTVALV